MYVMFVTKIIVKAGSRQYMTASLDKICHSVSEDFPIKLAKMRPVIRYPKIENKHIQQLIPLAQVEGV
jgi:hypothetical protein